MWQASDNFTPIIRRKRNPYLCASLFSLLFVLLTLAEVRPANPAIGPALEKFEAGKFKEAVSLLQTVLAHDPQNSSITFWLMRSYYELDMTEETVRAVERAAQLDPANSEYHQWLGRA